jgi:hypothetical protein
VCEPWTLKVPPLRVMAEAAEEVPSPQKMVAV